MALAGPPNVWTQMNYMPPRGHCNFKPSVLSPRCPCLRFMLHPLKSSSTYECDGCAHHASFHNMENKLEDEITKRWEVEAKEKEQEQDETRPRKRVRALEYDAALKPWELLDMIAPTPRYGKVKAKTGAKKPGARRSKALPEEDDTVVELD